MFEFSLNVELLRLDYLLDSCQCERALLPHLGWRKLAEAWSIDYLAIDVAH